MESEYVWVYLLVYLAVLFFQKKIKINDNTTSSLPTCPLREEKSFSQRAFSIYTDIRKLQDKAKTSYTLSTRRLRFGYEQQFSRSTPGACFGVVGEELTAYLILEMAGAMR